LYDFPKLIQIFGKAANEYQKMSSDDKNKLILAGAKALIAGAVKYEVTSSLEPLYSLIIQNSPWQTTVDWVANILKKYGGERTTHEVIEKAVGDVEKVLEGDKNSPAT